ncbi:hypothetical protein UABAM_00648 [Candidatus Uabimicrobium amorphum]|uniref:Phage shock protein PspC N-terminal domain-containing protein n=2 Tax=Uabimicrobium amorphum TaxID=2596890 RepID=A0A5S9IKK4_UABAM|nr:hypothetical protein UABAM_00648 [Candidatus Uabimicrobium amorphum]
MKQTCSKCGREIDGNWCDDCHSANFAWRRVREGSKIFGVCQGLSIYTHLPVAAIRLAFVVAAIFGGWGILLYLILCLFPARDASEASPLSQFEDDDSTGIGIFESSKKILYKFLSFIIFVILCACLYLPLFTICTVAVIVSISGWFYPYLQIGVYRSTFFELGAIGFLWGICNPLLGIVTIYFIVHWILTFHLKKWQWTITKTVITWFVIAATCVSCLWMFHLLHRKTHSKTWNVATTSQLSQILQTENIPIRRIFFTTHKKKQTVVTYSLYVHELSSNIVKNMDNIDMLWNEKPRWYNLHMLKKSFAYFDIFIYMPENENLELRGIPRLYITGKWRKVFLENIDEITLENTQIKTLNINTNGGKVRIENADVAAMYLYLTSCETIIDAFQGKDSKIYQNDGWLEMVDFAGKIQLQNIVGHCKIVRPLFENNNEITTDSGNIRIYFLHDFIPNLDCRGENIVNSAPRFSMEDKLLKIVSDNARVTLKMYGLK